MGPILEVCLSLSSIRTTSLPAKMGRKKGKKEEPLPAVEYKTVPCKKYWTVGHCELGPRCVYIHQEVSNAMAKQIVANNGELPPSVALSVPVKPVENVGAKNIKSLPRSGRACSGHKHPTFSYAAASKRPKGPGLEYDGYIGVGCNCKRWGSDHFQLDV